MPKIRVAWNDLFAKIPKDYPDKKGYKELQKILKKDSNKDKVYVEFEHNLTDEGSFFNKENLVKNLSKDFILELRLASLTEDELVLISAIPRKAKKANEKREIVKISIKDLIKKWPKDYPTQEEYEKIKKGLNSFLAEKAREITFVCSEKVPRSLTEEDIQANFPGVLKENLLGDLSGIFADDGALIITPGAKKHLESLKAEKPDVVDEDEDPDEGFELQESQHEHQAKVLGAYQNFRVGPKLVDLAGESPIAAHGEPINEQTYNLFLKSLIDQLESEELDNLKLSEDEYSMTITVQVPDKEDDSIIENQTIRYSYDDVEKCPKVTMSNPPDDQTIFMFMKSSRGIQPLTMDAPCGDLATAIRLFEASVISGTKITLSEGDRRSLLASDYADRYKTLTALLYPDNEEQLKEFREHASQEEYELGISDMTELYGLQMERPEFLTFESTKPKR